MDRIIEICCGSYEDAINAYRGGYIITYIFKY